MTEQTPWFIGELRIDEPITTITDLLVTVVCFYAYFKLKNLNRTDLSNKLLGYYFLGMGISTLIGGIAGHAFYYALNFYWKLPGWLFSMVSITMIERVVILQCSQFLSETWTKFLARLNLLELLIFMGLAFGALQMHPEDPSIAFKYVEIHSAYGLLGVVFSLSWLLYAKTKNKGAKIFLYAVGLCAIAAVIFIKELGIHRNFNHADLAHCFMAVAAYLFYKGGLHLNPVGKTA